MNEDIDRIAELKKRLYSRDPDNLPKRKYGILRPIKRKVHSTWGQTEISQEVPTSKKTASGYKRFFLFTLVFFIIAIGVALFSYYKGSVTLSSKNVELTILGNAFVGGGEELPIQVEISNKNSVDLINALLILNYPKGATDETGSDVVRIERPLGTVSTGKTKSEDFIAVLYGEQGSSREITATLSYQLQGSSSVFQKESTFSVMVSSSPVGLLVNAPTAVVSNQPFTITLRNTFSGDKVLNNVITRVEYPNGFVFQSATPAPISGNNIWNLGGLEKGDERIITVTGKIIGEENDEKAFRIYIGTPENETTNKIAVVYNSTLATLRLTQPFISGNILVNDNDEDTIALTIGENVKGNIKWVNNSSMSITNPTFTLSIEGDNFEASSISAPNSYYDALERTITWTPDSNSSLSTILPGAQGDFPFNFHTGASSSGSKDIKLALSIKGTFPERGNIEQSIESLDQKIIKFASNIQFGAQSIYSIGPIKNTGPYPPKADQETTYTMVWTILPTENALKNVRVSATLPPGINWTGVFIPNSENITYSVDSREVVWNVGSLPKATSSSKNRTISFQVKAKPTKSQVGSTLTLLSETTISALDTITNTALTSSRPPLTTKFDTDPVYTEGADRVIP